MEIILYDNVEKSICKGKQCPFKGCRNGERLFRHLCGHKKSEETDSSVLQLASQSGISSSPVAWGKKAKSTWRASAAASLRVIIDFTPNTAPPHPAAGCQSCTGQWRAKVYYYQ
jgi:hypothetical protein